MQSLGATGLVARPQKPASRVGYAFTPARMARMAKLEESKVAKSLAELGELLVDSLLDEESPVRELPVTKRIFQLLGVSREVSNWLLARKLSRFVKALDDVPEEKRDRLASRLAENPEYRRQVGEKLLEMVNRLEDEDKAELLAEAFKAMLLLDASMLEFRWIAHAIDHCFLPDLVQFGEVGAGQTDKDLIDVHPMFAPRLTSAGLIEQATNAPLVTAPDGSHGIFKYRLAPGGIIFLRWGLSQQAKRIAAASIWAEEAK